jgi:hypothetical protein
MTTLALRVPTAVPDQPNVSGGQCYILFTSATITAREVIAAKVQAELRKARMGGAAATSLPLLLPPGTTWGFSPLDEQLAIAQACRAFGDGQYLLLYNGRPLVELDEQVTLDRHTKLLFLHIPANAGAAEPATTVKRAA